MELSRRGFLGGLLAVVSAPAIVRVESLMVLPVKQQIILPEFLPVDVSFTREALLRAYIENWNNITRQAVVLFKNSNKFIENIDMQYDREFAKGSQWGSELKIRLPKHWQPATIANAEASPQSSFIKFSRKLPA
jgi:hypothetical protein